MSAASSRLPARPSLEQLRKQAQEKLEHREYGFESWPKLVHHVVLSRQFWEVADITDAGIAALVALPKLREVTVEGSPNVTRSGMAVFADRVRVKF